MEQDEDTHADSGGRSGGDVGLRADGAGGGEKGDGAVGGRLRKVGKGALFARRAHHSLLPWTWWARFRLCSSSCGGRFAHPTRPSINDGKLTACLSGRRWPGGQKPTTIGGV